MPKAKKLKEEVVKKARILLVKVSGGDELRVTLQAGSRITFAPNVPGGRGKGMNQYGEARPQGYAIRIYETAKNDSLVAVFTDVIEFRDVEIPVSKLVLREAGKTLWKSDETGFEVSTKVERSRATIDDAGLLLNQ